MTPLRKVLIISLMLATLIVPIIELSFGFYFIRWPMLCPIQNDIMLIMSIGGVFQAIFFAAGFGFIFSVVPVKYKSGESKKTNRISQILIGCIMSVFAGCAVVFFVLLQIRVYGNYRNVQWQNPDQPNYCLFTIFTSALGLIAGIYAAAIIFLVTAVILIFGLGV